MNTLVQQNLAAYQQFLGQEDLALERALEMEQKLRQEAEANNQLMLNEHGDIYIGFFCFKMISNILKKE